MFIRKLLGLEERAGTERTGDTATVRRIVQELEALPAERARWLAAFAYILNRVARADEDVSAAETQEMERTVARWGGVPAAQAVLVVQIAKTQASLFGATEDFLVTRQFKTVSTPEDREALLHCVFAVSAADDSISSAEETLARQIASELGIADPDFLAIRARYSDKRAILKDLPGT